MNKILARSLITWREVIVSVVSGLVYLVGAAVVFGQSIERSNSDHAMVIDDHKQVAANTSSINVISTKLDGLKETGDKTESIVIRILERGNK